MIEDYNEGFELGMDILQNHGFREWERWLEAMTCDTDADTQDNLDYIEGFKASREQQP